jgi:serine/threonine protein kinase
LNDGILLQNNVLVDEFDNVRLCDFGRSNVVGEPEYQTTLFAGFLPCMAPELFPVDESINLFRLFTPSSDIYAFGILAFEVDAYFRQRCSSAHYIPQIFTDKVPFRAPNFRSPFHIVIRVLSGERPLRSSDTQHRISDIMWETIRNCWAADPKARPTAAKIIQWIG